MNCDCCYNGFCFFDSGEAQQQYFVERPQNVSVREGQTAILRCKVGNQQGRAQWTKDGFALGKCVVFFMLYIANAVQLSIVS